MTLVTITEGRKPVNCWLHGRPGAGKTATVKFILRELEKEAGIRGIYVNCWENPTIFSVLECVARELRMLRAEKLSTSFKLERLKKHISNQQMVVVLDEIDQPPPKERNTILYNLFDLPTVGQVCVCNSQYVYFDLEERVKSRLNPTRVLFEEYMQRTINAAIDYENSTGGVRKIGITGEVGEVLACYYLKLKLCIDPRAEGYDALDFKGHRVQIKTRRSESEGLPNDAGRIGTFSNHPFDYVLLIILDRLYNVAEIWQAKYRDVWPLIQKHKRRNPNLSSFKKTARQIWPKKMGGNYGIK